MVPEIWSETDKIFCHFGSFYDLLPPPPPNDPENQNFEKKNEKNAYMCTINVGHMIYGS